MSESDRRDIYNSLESALGHEPANNLMKLLPYKPADQLVTRADMHAQTAMLQGEMAELRGEMAELRGELRGDMAGLRGEVRELRGDFDSKFADLKISTQRIVATGVAANVIALLGGMVM